MRVTYVTPDGRENDEHPGGHARLRMRIPTPGCVVLAAEGDWIVRGAKGDLWPYKPEVFAAAYEPVG